MRLIRASVLFFFFICPFCFGQTADSPTSAAAVNSSEQPTPHKKVIVREQRMSPGRSWNEAVRQKLKKRFDLNYDGISWREIEKELETKFGFNIELDSSAIGESLSYDEPVCSSNSTVF